MKQPKERITITIDRSILDAVDHQIDGRVIRNRSHAIDVLLDRALRGQ